MKLHKDRYAFLTIIGIIHEASGIRSDVLEKDYYVSMLLKELAEKQLSLPAYFKGGTALYKAQKSIRRFSEDIDLTVCIDGCSNSQAKKRLEAATKKYRSLPRTVRKELEDDRKGSITAVYDYVPIVTVDIADPLQRFGFVKVEGTSFTVSEPFSELEVEPAIYTLASREQREILKEQYGVEPFTINTIRMERIFADKIFAAEFYYERAMYFDAAKHIYDVSVMTGLDSIKELLQNYMEFQRMLNYKKLEETHRTGSDLSDKKYDDFGIFAGIEKNNELKDAFGVMQDNYVFTDDDILPFDYVVHEWQELKKVLLTLDS